jgi:hypothetical protein
MFAIGREETLSALESMEENNLKYYDAHCPKCRRANRVERFRLEFSYPGWKADLQAMASRAEASSPGPAGIGEPLPTPPSVAPAPPSPSPAPLEVKKAHIRTHGHAATKLAKLENATARTITPAVSAQKGTAVKGTAASTQAKQSTHKPIPASAKGKAAVRRVKPRKAARPTPAKGKKPTAKKKK